MSLWLVDSTCNTNLSIIPKDLKNSSLLNIKETLINWSTTETCFLLHYCEKRSLLVLFIMTLFIAGSWDGITISFYASLE